MQRVLIVDDDEIHLDVMRRKLERYGFEVHVASNPIGVTNLVRTLRPDVVLMDVSIPAIRGDRLLDLVRQKAPRTTRFFYHSSIDQDELQRISERDSMTGWFSKSDPLARVVRRLQQEIRPS
ncbi:MAG: response regulator [Myxococcales bacterium]|nr:response regulator [Myxococcales bacterium]